MKTFLIWCAGFLVLFLINVLVEAAILPAMGLENTPKNDIYFKCWWAVVAFWLVFGNQILGYFIKSDRVDVSNGNPVGG